MQQVKLFKGVESEIGAMESEINDWLKNNPTVRVVSMIGNIAPQTLSDNVSSARQFPPSDILMGLLYENG